MTKFVCVSTDNESTVVYLPEGTLCLHADGRLGWLKRGRVAGTLGPALVPTKEAIAKARAVITKAQEALGALAEDAYWAKGWQKIRVYPEFEDVDADTTTLEQIADELAKVGAEFFETATIRRDIVVIQ